MFRKILHYLLLVSLIGAVGILGYIMLDPIRNAAPAITTLSGNCEVADGIGYRAIVSIIDISDAASLYREIRDLKRLGIKEVHFYINSPGGVLFDSMAIYDAIKRLSNEGVVTVAEIEGGCMSSAVLVAAACSYRTAAPHCNFLVHNVSGGTEKDLPTFCRKYAEILAENSNLTADEWEAKMEAETWFTAQEALEWGLIDEII